MRMRHLTGVAAALAAATLATAAQAQAPAPAQTQDNLTRDVRCLVILSNMKLPAEQQTALGVSVAYLFGRIDAGSRDSDWVDRVAAEAKSMEGKDVSAEQRACGAFLVTKGRLMVERGERLKAMGEAPTKP